MGTPWARLTTQKRPGVIGRPYHSCVVFGVHAKHGSEATNAETRSCIRRCLLGALREQSCGLSGMTFRTFA